MNANSRDATRGAHQRVLQLVRTLGHDLTGPARRIASFARILGQDLEDNADPSIVRDSLLHLRNESSRMLDLVEGLRRYARLALEEPQPMAPTDLRSVIDAAVGDLEEALHESGIVLAIDVSDRWNVRRDQLRVAITHIIRNAIQHGGAGCSTITVTSRIEGDHLELAVRDNGRGPITSQLEDLFGPFYTTAAGGAGGGEALGLGLAYCQLVADHHAGELRAERMDPGFRVVLRLGKTELPCDSESRPQVGQVLGG